MSDIDALLVARIPNTLTTATGDLIAASAPNTPARLPVGTAGQVLTVVSGAPAWASPTSVLRGSRAAVVAATGTTFAGGTDILTAALSLTADGVSTYRIVCTASAGDSSGGTGRVALNLDGAEGGRMAAVTNAQDDPIYASIIVTPSAGVHTINVRLYVTAGTFTLFGGAGGVGNAGPIEVLVVQA